MRDHFYTVGNVFGDTILSEWKKDGASTWDSRSIAILDGGWCHYHKSWDLLEWDERRIEEELARTKERILEESEAAMILMECDGRKTTSTGKKLL